MDDAVKERTELWLKLWGVAVALHGLSMIWIKAPIDSVVITCAYGLALGVGKRIQGMRIMILGFAAFLAFVHGLATLVHPVAPTLLKAIYFFAGAVFYIVLFIFLRRPQVKAAFGAMPGPPLLPEIDSAEETKLRFWVRIVAAALIIEGVMVSSAIEPLIRYGAWHNNSFMMLFNVALALLFFGVAAGGLLSFRKNIGRRYTLILCMCFFIFSVDDTISGTKITGWGHLYFGALSLFFLACFLFLLHPKVKAVFEKNSAISSG